MPALGNIRFLICAMVVVCSPVLKAEGKHDASAFSDTEYASPELAQAWLKQRAQFRFRAGSLSVIGVTVSRFRWHDNLDSWSRTCTHLLHASHHWLGVDRDQLMHVSEPDRSSLKHFLTVVLPKRIRPRNTLMFYLGTHHLKDGRLLLADGDAITASELHEWLSALPVKEIIWVTDVCFSERMEQSVSFREDEVRLYASGADEKTPEVPVKGKLRAVEKLFAPTLAAMQVDWHASSEPISLMGLGLLHAIRQATSDSRQQDIELQTVWDEACHFRDQLDEDVRRIRFSRFGSKALRSIILSQVMERAGDSIVLPLAPSLAVHQGDSFPVLEDLLKQPDDKIDVGLANLLMGDLLEGTSKTKDHIRTLEKWADDLRLRIGEERKPDKIAAILNRYVFEEKKVTAMEDPYARDFLLSEVFMTNRGRCSALVTLYIALGQRLGYNFRAVCVPEHIFVRWHKNEGDGLEWPAGQTAMVFETTQGGANIPGEIYRQSHQWGATLQANSFYMRSLTFMETVGALYSPLASAYLVNGDVEKAIEYGRLAITINANDAEAWNNLGLARRRAGQIDLAIAGYKQALLINPNFAEAWNNLGTVLSASEARIDAWKKAVVAKPDLAIAWANLAKAYYQKSQFELALACSKRCEELGQPLGDDFLQKLQIRPPQP